MFRTCLNFHLDVVLLLHEWKMSGPFCSFIIGQETWHKVTSECSRPCQSKWAICFCRMKTSAYFPFYLSGCHMVHCSPDFLLAWRCGVCLALTDWLCSSVSNEDLVQTAGTGVESSERWPTMKQRECNRESGWTGHSLSLLLVKECLSEILCVRGIGRAQGAAAPFTCLC